MSTLDREAIFHACHQWIETIECFPDRIHAFDKLAAYQATAKEQLPIDYLRGAYRLATETYAHDDLRSKWLAFSSHIRYLVGGVFHREILRPGTTKVSWIYGN